MALSCPDPIEYQASWTPAGGQDFSPDCLPPHTSTRELIYPFVRWGFYGFVFSIPFEYPERDIPLEVHTITGSVFLLLTLLQPRLCFRSTPPGLLCFAACLCLYLIRVCFTEHAAEGLKLFGNLVQVFFLFWTSYNLLKDEHVAKTVLLVFIAACTLVVILGRLGITDAGRLAARGDFGRLTTFGQDPNGLASRMALSIIVLVGLAFGAYRVRFRSTLLVWPLIALYLATFEYVGSRGAYLALLIGLVVGCFRGSLFKSKTFVIALLVAGLCAGISYRAGNMWGRLERTFQSGSMSGRERIYPEAWQMVLEQPLWGFGPADRLYELESRVQDNRAYRDTHNMLFELLTSCGIWGAVPFFTCIALCVRAAWKARAGAAGMIPLAAIATLLAMSMTIEMMASKTLWLVLAYAAAAGSSLGPDQVPGRFSGEAIGNAEDPYLG